MRAKIASHSFFYPAADLSRPTTKERWRSTDSCTTGSAAHSPFPATLDALCSRPAKPAAPATTSFFTAVPSGGRRSPVAVGPLDRSMPNRTSIDSLFLCLSVSASANFHSRGAMFPAPEGGPITARATVQHATRQANNPTQTRARPFTQPPIHPSLHHLRPSC